MQFAYFSCTYFIYLCFYNHEFFIINLVLYSFLLDKFHTFCFIFYFLLYFLFFLNGIFCFIYTVFHNTYHVYKKMAVLSKFIVPGKMHLASAQCSALYRNILIDLIVLIGLKYYHATQCHTSTIRVRCLCNIFGVLLIRE